LCNWTKLLAFVATASIAPAGCGRPMIERPPTYQVRGRVSFGGQPATGAEVLLWALDDAKLYGVCPHATVQSDGTFQITTYKTGDGAPPGKYALTLTWPTPPARGMDDGPDRFRGRYADPARPLVRLEIATVNVELETINLQ
jgi:hypothetical protein